MGLQRLIEHCCTAQVKNLVDEIVCQAASLCKHLYANFILQSVLEHGTSEQCARIAQAIIANALQLSKHKISSNVVRAALVHSPEREKLALIHVLTADSREFTQLSNHRIGSFVAREVKHVRAVLSAQ